MKSFLNNISIIIIFFLITVIIMLSVLNSGQNTIQMNNIEKYGKTLAGLLAKACENYIICQQYDGFYPYFDSLMKNDSDIVEVFCVNSDGKYLAYKNIDNNKKIEKNMSQKLLSRYQKEKDTFSIISDDGKYIDFVSSINVGSLIYGYVVIKYNLESINKNNVTNKMF